MKVLISSSSLSYHTPDCPVVSHKVYEDNGMKYPFYEVELEEAEKMTMRDRGNTQRYKPCPRCFPEKQENYKKGCW